MSVVVLEGWGGSGKSLLLSYLDGHSELFAMPVHDKLIYDFMMLRANDLHCKDQDIRHLRKVLSSHGYYNIEYNASRGVIPVLLSTKKDDVIEVPFKFKFEKFEKSWKSKILDNITFSRERLIELFYTSFLESVETKDYKDISSINSFVTLGDARSCCPVRFLNTYPNSKLIYVKRSIPELIGIRSNRKTPSGLTRGMFEKDFLTVLLSGELQRIVDYEHKLNIAKNLNPTRVLTVEFDHLLLNRDKTLISIQKFLECSIEKLSPSMLCYSLGNDTQNYGTQKNDSVESLLSPGRILFIEFFAKLGSKSIFLNRVSLACFKLLFFVLRLIRFICK